MSGKMWTKELIKQLIREFRTHELLYDPNHINYLNRAKSKECFEKICKSLKKYNGTVTIPCIKKKVKSLRTQFTRANRVMAKSIQNATDEDASHQPVLWCYEELSFLSAYKSKRSEICNLHGVWAELNYIQRKHQKEMDKSKTSVTYDDESLTSSEDATLTNDTISQIYEDQSLPSPDVVKEDIAVKQELHHNDPLFLQSSSITVAVPETKSYSEPTETNPTSDTEETNVISLLQKQLQMQTRQLEMIDTMLKSIETLGQKKIEAMELKTAAIVRQTETTERQTAAIEDLIMVCQEGKWDEDD